MAYMVAIPISTCRYPNQIAKIAVYPSIEWGLDFDFGITRPQDKILVHERKNFNDILGFGFLNEAKEDDPIKYNVDLGFVYKIDKQKVEFEISQAKKLLSIISFALKARSKLQGIIKGSIEISTKVQIKSKVMNKEMQPENDKYHKKAELSIGAKGSSYVTLTVPTELNSEGDLDVDFFFSGVKVEFWFKASLNSKKDDGKPDYSKKLIPHADFKKTIKF
ncbi:hypothetical protein [Tenacibaculum sp. SDUM215027]|uniref:hypothetical protein n=1 Tax=Tenacibaculum sp. SDUM215027 TaxID=3422596 RepID=UPI003D321C2F